MSRKAKCFILFLICFLCTESLFAKEKVRVYIILNDFYQTRDQVEVWSESVLMKDKKLKITSANILHFTDKSDRNSRDRWKMNKNKTDVNYESFKATCGVMNCDQLGMRLSAYSSSVTNDVLIHCGNVLDCDKSSWGIDETVEIASNEIGKIREAMKKQIKANKGSKKDLNIYLYVSVEFNLPEVSVSFDRDTVLLKDGEVLNLNPITSDNVERISWSPMEGLECNDCFSPLVTLKASKLYHVQVSDALNCVSDEANVYVQYVDDCICNLNSERLEGVLERRNNPEENCPDYYENNYIESNQTLYTLSSRENGAYVYHIYTKKYCAPEYYLEVIDRDTRNVIYKKYYKKDEVDHRSGIDDKLIDRFYIFRLSLTHKKHIIEQSEAFVIRITPIDKRGTMCEAYLSSHLNLQGCKSGGY